MVVLVRPGAAHVPMAV